MFAKPFAAVLFDMDGTLINSIAVAERVWAAWARKHGLDVERFLPTIHGRRVQETIAAQGLVGIDIEAEAAAITAAEIADVGGIVPIPGARSFLAQLPPDKIAVVTSAPRALAVRRLEAAGVPPPRTIVSAEDVTRGKPAPDPYLLAAKRLDVAITDCLVVEDAPVGIAAGEASGATLLIITATHEHPMSTSHAAIASFESLCATRDGAAIRITATKPAGGNNACR